PYAVASVFLPTDPAAPATHPLSLHDALPICLPARAGEPLFGPARARPVPGVSGAPAHQSLPLHVLLRARGRRGRRLIPGSAGEADRKSTRLNSSHVSISYAVFSLKKKKPILR